MIKFLDYRSRIGFHGNGVNSNHQNGAASDPEIKLFMVYELEFELIFSVHIK